MNLKKNSSGGIFFLSLLFIMMNVNVCALGKKQVEPEPVTQTPQFFFSDAEIFTSTPEQTEYDPHGQTEFVSFEQMEALSEQTEPVPPEQSVTDQARPEITRAEQVMKALASAYPRQIEKAEFHDDDWAVLMRGTWYYYAGGRLLPEDLRDNAADYTSQPFYNYPGELPPWRDPTPEEQNRYRNTSSNRTSNPPRRSPHFFDDLWRAHDRDESYERVKTIRFLGLSTMVHYLILEELSLVEEHIFAAAKTDPQVQAWINSLSSLEGWSWRNIAETQSRSYHSYGLAVDLIPRSWGGRETYWLWTTRTRADWWNVSYNNRFHPPDAVIKAFEKFGFIWGGKWTLYDTMHFEYRPEILILSGMSPEMSR